MANPEIIERGRLKRFLPTSLFGRALLILVLPMLILQASAIYFFYAQHWKNVERHLSLSLAGDVAFLVREMETADPRRQREIQADARQHLRIDIKREPADANATHFPSVTDDAVFHSFAEYLRDALDEPFSIRLPRGETHAILAVQLPNETLRLRFSIKRLYNITTDIFVWWMIGSALLLLLVATLFLRNQIRPIRKLAEAAESFGKGQDRADFRPQGASEVRQAGRSFLAMRERLKRMIAARTEMLAAISHDLRTPLTRMHLELAMLPDQGQARPLIADVQEMEHMIQEYLDFARGEGGEEASRVSLRELLAELTGRYADQGRDVTLAPGADPLLSLFPNAMRRCLANVIDNALRYGTRSVVTIEEMPRRVEILLDDDGPGIPPESRELALRAFTRLDESRNLDAGGTGLGLSIVQDIVLRHGGEMTLEDSPLGGLRVRIRLPL